MLEILTNASAMSDIVYLESKSISYSTWNTFDSIYNQAFVTLLSSVYILPEIGVFNFVDIVVLISLSV